MAKNRRKPDRDNARKRKWRSLEREMQIFLWWRIYRLKLSLRKRQQQKNKTYIRAARNNNYENLHRPINYSFDWVPTPKWNTDHYNNYYFTTGSSLRSFPSGNFIWVMILFPTFYSIRIKYVTLFEVKSCMLTRSIIKNIFVSTPFTINKARNTSLNYWALVIIFRL